MGNISVSRCLHVSVNMYHFSFASLLSPTLSGVYLIKFKFQVVSLEIHSCLQFVAFVFLLFIFIYLFILFVYFSDQAVHKVKVISANFANFYDQLSLFH